MATAANAVTMKTNVVSEHQGLVDFEGEWQVEQKQWSGPGAKPTTNHGKSVCKALLDGLATLITIDTTGEHGPNKGVGLFTWNTAQKRFDAVWLDSYSKDGLLSLSGERAQGPSMTTLAAGKAGATQERQWNTAATAATCVGPKLATELMTMVDRDAAAVGQTPLRFVENKLSKDHWVLDISTRGADGKEFLIQQNSYTR